MKRMGIRRPRWIVPYVTGASILTALASMSVAASAPDPPMMDFVLPGLERVHPLFYKDRGTPRLDVVVTTPVDTLLKSDRTSANHAVVLVFHTYLGQLARKHIAKECSAAIGGGPGFTLNASVEAHGERIEGCVKQLIYVLLDRHVDTQALALSRRLTASVLAGLHKSAIWSRRTSALVEIYGRDSSMAKLIDPPVAEFHRVTPEDLSEWQDKVFRLGAFDVVSNHLDLRLEESARRLIAPHFSLDRNIDIAWPAPALETRINRFTLELPSRHEYLLALKMRGTRSLTDARSGWIAFAPYCAADGLAAKVLARVQATVSEIECLSERLSPNEAWLFILIRLPLEDRSDHSEFIDSELIPQIVSAISHAKTVAFEAASEFQIKLQALL